MDFKQFGNSAIKFGAGASGLAAGVVGLKLADKALPASTPALVRKVAPGLAVMLVSMLLNAKVDERKTNIRAILLGLGLAGFSDALKKSLPDQLATIKNNIPTLSGTPGYASVNTGDFPPSYYKENTFQGVPINGTDNYALMGVPMNGLRGLGSNSYALNGETGNAYALNGLGNNAYSLS